MKFFCGTEGARPPACGYHVRREQALLSTGRGLMAAPKFLIIDEASLGLPALVVKKNFGVIRRINEAGAVRENADVRAAYFVKN